MKPLSVPFMSGPRIRHPIEFNSSEDRAEFYRRLDTEEQESVKSLHDAMVRIAAAPNPTRGSKQQERLGREGWSAKRLRAVFDEWDAAGRDWRDLVNKRRYPDVREPNLPLEFQEYIKAKFSSNQRKNAPAYRQIVRQWEHWWETGDPRYALPGYAECPPPGAQARYPRGWSEKNLNRFAPPKAELVMARIGVHAAMAVLPHIPGTRDGVRFLEWVSGDDVWLDRKIVVPGYGAVRVVQFGLMDYGASYYLSGFTQRPVLPRDDGSVETLKRRDFLWTLAMMLERYGYPLDYPMHILCERGTATMTRAEARFLYEVSEGQINVGYNTMEGEMVHAWEERKTGNSRTKSWHESFHNLFHNEQADLPGQVGKDRDHTPAALHGRERHALALNDVAMLLTPEQRLRLKMPFPNATECMLQTVERVNWINGRKDHECEGFEQVMEWCPRGMRMLPRPEAELLTWLEKNPRASIEDVDWFPRPESPTERMHRLSAGCRFMRLPDAVWRRFYEDCHEQQPIAADGSFSFIRDKKSYRFVPPTTEESIPPGTKVSGFYRPDGSAIHLFAGDQYLLTWPAEKRVRRDAVQEKAQAFERKRSFLNRAIKETQANMAHEIEIATADARNNLAIMAEAGLLDAAPAPEGEHRLARVQDGCTAAARAVQGVTEGLREQARQRREDARKAAESERLARTQGAADLDDMLSERLQPACGVYADTEPLDVSDIL